MSSHSPQRRLGCGGLPTWVANRDRAVPAPFLLVNRAAELMSAPSHRDNLTLLHAHLWSIQAEVESQVRNLMKVHRELDHLAPVDDPHREAEVARLANAIEEIRDANRTVGALCDTALQEAHFLRPHEQTKGVDK